MLQRYLDLRLDGEIYPLGGNVKEIFDTLLGTSSWYLKTIGLQLVAETFAVSLFRMLAESSKDAVLREVCRRILQDEARHMGFAMLSLPAMVAQATEAEHREMEDFAVWALSRTLAGTFPLAVYQEIGMGKAELDEMKQFRRERAAGGDETAFRKYFRRDLHDGLVRNLRKVGLITDRIAPSLQVVRPQARGGLRRSIPPHSNGECRRLTPTEGSYDCSYRLYKFHIFVDIVNQTSRMLLYARTLRREQTNPERLLWSRDLSAPTRRLQVPSTTSDRAVHVRFRVYRRPTHSRVGR